MKTALKQRQQRRERNKKGLCPQCGQGKKAPKRSRCLRCLAQASILMANRTRRLKKAGLCVQCGQKKEQPERTRCNRCLAQVAKRARERTKRLRDAGLCGRCGDVPSVPVRCPKCQKAFARAWKRYGLKRKKAQAMKESRLVSQIILAVKTHYPRAWVRKLADRYTRGLPDILILFPRRDWGLSESIGVLWVETKSASGKCSAIQLAEQEKIMAVDAEGVEVIVAKSVDEVLKALDELRAVGTKERMKS